MNDAHTEDTREPKGPARFEKIPRNAYELEMKNSPGERLRSVLADYETRIAALETALDALGPKSIASALTEFADALAKQRAVNEVLFGLIIASPIDAHQRATALKMYEAASGPTSTA